MYNKHIEVKTEHALVLDLAPNLTLFTMLISSARTGSGALLSEFARLVAAYSLCTDKTDNKHIKLNMH